MSSRKATPPRKRDGTTETTVKAAPHEPRAVLLAKALIVPAMRGAYTIEAFTQKHYGETDWRAILDTLRQQNDELQRGSLTQAESLLMTQAETLDAIYHELARRAALYMDEQLAVLERYLRLALKAQSQCRTTLETLAAIKNPPVVIARQANIAHGHQQVNNGVSAANATTVAHAENPDTDRNELLETQHGQRLDAGASGSAIGTDSAMATLGEIDRPPKR